MFYRFTSGTVHKEFTKDDEDYHYDANPYNKCSPEYGCPRMTWSVNLDGADENYECPLFDMPSESSVVVEPCTECIINEDCGEWDLNHMKCENSKCICGQNWLIGKNRRCNKLNRIGINMISN